MKYVAENGEVIIITSIEEAEALASKLSEVRGRPVSLQSTAPQDPTTADTYLVYRSIQRTHSPIDPDSDIWTFETTANQYGALGEVLFTRGAPALRYFIKQDLERDDIWVRVMAPRHAVSRGTVSRETRNNPSWAPDAVAIAYGEDSLQQEHWCEIKTGDASFHRRQTEGMAYLASIGGVSVLTIRVWIDDLPNQYPARIEKVLPQ